MVKELIDVKWGQAAIENLSYGGEIDDIIEDIFSLPSVVSPGGLLHVFPMQKYMELLIHVPKLTCNDEV